MENTLKAKIETKNVSMKPLKWAPSVSSQSFWITGIYCEGRTTLIPGVTSSSKTYCETSHPSTVQSRLPKDARLAVRGITEPVVDQSCRKSLS